MARWRVVVLTTLVATMLSVATPASLADSNNTVLLPGSSWLGGAGVDVYQHNKYLEDAEITNYVNHPDGGQVASGLKWQCVELINRLYISHGWISQRWQGNGGGMFDSAPAHLEKSAQGQILSVMPGDVVVLQGGPGGFGHANVVDSVVVNGDGSRTVRTVNQNTQSVRISRNLVNGRLGSYLSGYTVRGVIHAPVDEPPRTGGDAPPAVAVGANGDASLAAVSRVGTLSSREFRAGSWGDMGKHGTSGSWSTMGTVAIGVGGDHVTWLVATSDDGSLFTRFNEGSSWSSLLRHGSAGTWSTEAQPAITVDGSGRAWIAAVTKNGSLYSRMFDPASGRWSSLVRHGSVDSWSTTGTVGIGTDTAGKLLLVAISSNGTMFARTFTPDIGFTGTWTAFTRHGSAGVWSKDAAPSAAVADNGSFFLAGVYANGSLFTRTGTDTTWAALQAHGGRGSWSPKATPALVATPDGRVLLAAVTKAGSLFFRERGTNGMWSSLGRMGVAESWSSEAGPGLDVGANGTAQLAAINKAGSLFTRTRTASAPWTPLIRHGVAESWAGGTATDAP